MPGKTEVVSGFVRVYVFGISKIKIPNMNQTAAVATAFFAQSRSSWLAGSVMSVPRSCLVSETEITRSSGLVLTSGRAFSAAKLEALDAGLESPKSRRN